MRPQVTAFTDCDLVHTSFVSAGLIELANNGLIDLDFRLQKTAWRDYRGRFTVLLRVSTEHHEPRFACVDVHDSSSYFSHSSLERCVRYFKSNFDPRELRQLAPEFRERVQPLGLYFGCRSARDRDLPTRHVGSVASLVAKSKYRLRSALKYDEAYRMFGISVRRLRRYRQLLKISEYESDPRSDRVEPKIYFQTRLFPERNDEVRNMNRNRAELIRALRKEFGSRFIGGLSPSIESRELYPDCLSTLDSSLHSHIDRVRSSLICVYSNGLDNSFAWKLAEYMASAKCIVSEQWHNSVANPPEAGRDMFFFKTIDECINACAALLTDKSTSTAVRESIAKYYSSYVRPSTSMWRVVKELTNCDLVPSLDRGKP